jgi:hypothetical protein
VVGPRVYGRWHSLATEVAKRAPGTNGGLPIRGSRAAGAGTTIAQGPTVTNAKQLVRDALAGFLLGVLVVSTVALVTWTTRPAAAEAR